MIKIKLIFVLNTSKQMCKQVCQSTQFPG